MSKLIIYALMLLAVAPLAVTTAAAYETPKHIVNYDTVWTQIGNNWNQASPYNTMINARYQAATQQSGSWYVGCVATAGCMIQNFFRFPAAISTADNDGTKLGASYGGESAAGLGVDVTYSEGAYDWANLDATLKARVSWNTAIAAKMRFNLTSSSGSSVLSDQLASALRGYLNFKSGFEVKGFSKGRSTFYEHFIYQQLRIGIPVVLSIAGNNQAHCVVANGFGYNAANEPIVHIAYGWEGASDGWYKLDAMAAGYTAVNAAIIAIRPNDYYFAPVTGRVTLPDGTGVVNEPVTYTSPAGTVYEAVTDAQGYFAIAADFFKDTNGTVRVQNQEQRCYWRLRASDDRMAINKATGEPFDLGEQGIINEKTYIENKGSSFSVTWDDFESYDPLYQSFPDMTETFVIEEPTNAQPTPPAVDPTDNPPASAGEYVTINWNSAGGSQIEPWTVAKLSKVTVPPVPVWQDHRFAGWYYYDQPVEWASDSWKMGLYGDTENFTAYWTEAPGYVDTYVAGVGQFVTPGGGGETPDTPPVTPDTPPGQTEEPAVDDGSGTEVAIEPVSGIYRTYGYDMCENYYMARKQAIKNRKLLFVLSGSASCNYCQYTKER